MKKKILIGFLVLSMFLFTQQPNKALDLYEVEPIPSTGYITVNTHEICVADTMIQRVSNPDILNWLSFPDISKLQVGCHYAFFPDFCWESYFYFDYHNKPENITKAEIRISIYETCCSDKTFSLCVYLADWTTFSNYTHIVYGGVERHLWLSLPNKTEFIVEIENTSESTSYIQFDITEYMYRDNLSIVLTPSVDEIIPENHIYLHSEPRLIWTSHEYDDMPTGIQIRDPQENQIFNNTPPSFDVQVWDRLSTGIDSQWYTLNNTNSTYAFSLTDFRTGTDSYGEYISGNGVGVINQEAWDSFGNGDITIRFYAKDGNGNIGYREIVVIKNTSEINNDSVIPYIIGFSVGFGILGLVIAVGVIYYLKKVRK